MVGESDFDNIVAGFYRAASGSIGWIEALAPFRTALSAFAVHLHAVDVSRGSLAFSYAATEISPEAELDYIRTYHLLDPRTKLVLEMQPGEWMHCWERFDDDFVAADRFYQEFLIPYGGRYVSGVRLLQDDSLNIILGVHRGNGSPKLSGDEIAVCKRLGRHLTDALVMYRANIHLRRQNQLGVDLLNRLRAPLVLLDEQRHLLLINRAARDVLENSLALVQSGGRLFCSRSQDDNALALALRKLLTEDQTSFMTAHAKKVFLRINAGSDQSALDLYMYPLHPKDTLHMFGERPLAMVLVHEPWRRVELDPFVVAAAFDLTPGEARVAVATAGGLAPEDIAAHHAVSINTVRSQLRAIFMKTSTTRQADLVSLLASLPVAAFATR